MFAPFLRGFGVSLLGERGCAARAVEFSSPSPLKVYLGNFHLITSGQARLSRGLQVLEAVILPRDGWAF